ncbi:MAG: UDP-N-acetylmuramate dehydrogenase [Saprospiraceae bacterium]|nr:UDP-N-acetylmuramate dehydrogenase [Saprospiraceae bacterium]MBK7796936.1 UDP-N-acetylmuramate dehydrogenase [Saprospiraceae bacterium]MBK8152263.1 UDP-N-acetylmuramate dehydrogenase [Saprospiraceae bacterium]
MRFSLKNLNTFGIEAHCQNLIEIKSIAQLKEIVPTLKNTPLVLGGGSNILFTQDVEQDILHNTLKGIQLLEEKDESAFIKVFSGENWHQFVEWSLSKGFYGIENLSLIPGSCGAAPIQNIGAYGVELKDVVDSVEVVDFEEGKTQTFTKTECKFGYRDSIFKNELKSKVFITSINLKLSKNPTLIRSEYGSIKEELLKQGITNPTPIDISKTVIKIRQSKLPDPKNLGNAGSFFKNPVLSLEEFNLIRHHDMPYYPQADGNVKVPAAWLIEKSGWKGYRRGDVGCHYNQALVLVNYGKASGSDILNLARDIQTDIMEKYGITLQPEVNIWP